MNTPPFKTHLPLKNLAECRLELDPFSGGNGKFGAVFCRKVVLPKTTVRGFDWQVEITLVARSCRAGVDLVTRSKVKVIANSVVAVMKGDWCQWDFITANPSDWDRFESTSAKQASATR